jgi:hypothetical protein
MHGGNCRDLVILQAEVFQSELLIHNGDPFTKSPQVVVDCSVTHQILLCHCMPVKSSCLIKIMHIFCDGQLSLQRGQLTVKMFDFYPAAVPQKGKEIIEDQLYAYQKYGTIIECGYDYYNRDVRETMEVYIEDNLEELSADENGFNDVTMFIKLPALPAKGDVTADGKINMFDYMKIKSFYFNVTSLTDAEIARADLTSDGKVNMFDYMKLKAIVFAQ